MGLLYELLSLLAPERCVWHVGLRSRGLCARLRSGLTYLDGPMCSRCGRPTAWPVQRCRECADRRVAFCRARAAVAYEGVAVAFVSAWKERGERSLSARASERMLGAFGRPEVDRMTP